MSLILKFKDYFNSLTTPEHRMAWTIAIAADALQIAAFPLFAEGALSPFDSVLDVAVAFLMVRLLGWHWAFLPTLANELIPGADLFPTWTAAVWFVTHQQRSAESGFEREADSNFNANSDRFKAASNPGEPEILPPGPAPQPRR
jgi:hypothetical protein